MKPYMQDSLRHWRPVYLSHRLGHRPLELKLFDREIALFRGADGVPHALNNRCPHRKMRLATGYVEGSELICPYHGWRFASDGSGKSPGTPEMRIVTECYEVQERFGAIWLREPGGDEMLPELDFPGYREIALLHHPLEAPLGLLLENMMELEHTASVHSIFGFEHTRLHEVKTSCKRNGSRLDIYYEGLQRRLPLYLGATTGIRQGDRFVQYASVGFTPAQAVYDLEWHGRHGARALQLKFVIYFNERSPTQGEQFTFVYARGGNAWMRAVLAAFGSVLAFNINRELMADIRLVESLRLSPQDERSYRYGRFDQPLLIRRKLAADCTPVVIKGVKSL
jgi:vanillate O-demethylase monooxygenase subunit